MSVDPRRAGWRHLSFAAQRLLGGGELPIGGASESVVVTLAGGLTLGLADGTELKVPGRPSVWAGLPWAVYLPSGTSAVVRPMGDAAHLAIASAPASAGNTAAEEPILITPDDVVMEIRGAGNATRQINHIVTPEFPADRLEVVEVYTPSGNWSSWPPHKHDTDDMPREAVLEEIYYYAFRRPEAWGIQRLYRRDGSRDAIWAVADGDVVLVTDGYHPFVAAHGDDAYYLNALAGDRRTMACSFDPDLDWIRERWPAMEHDPRVPLVKRR